MADATMVDPFEVRVKFSSQLDHMKASSHVAQHAATYMLKHKDLYEDLHSCIIEQIESSTSVNTRANILFFIEQLCDMARKDRQEEIIRMTQKELFRIVDAVAPPDGAGAANVKAVRQVLASFQDKGFISAETCDELNECLKERDIVPGHPSVSPKPGEDDLNKPTSAMLAESFTTNGLAKPDQRTITERMEQDRERSKRAREAMMVCDYKRPADEYWAIMEDVSDIGEDDIRIDHEEHLAQEQLARVEFE